MGTPDFSRVSLEKIYNAGFDIVGVVTTPDRPAGRGMKLVESEVKKFAVEKGLTIFQPEKISKNDEFKDAIRALDPDLVIVVSYGVILPKSFLKIPKLGCINVHPSLLPKYRGSAPIQWAILNGDEETGVSIMYLDEGMDSGDVIKQQKVTIGEYETTGELWDRLSVIGADLLLECVKNIENGKEERYPQPEEFTLAPMLDKEMSKIDWKTKSVKEIKDLIRGLNPIMGCYNFIGGKKLKFWRSIIVTVEEYNASRGELESIDYDKATAGQIMLADSKKGLFIKAKDGILKMIEVQGENAKKMPTGDFLRGNKLNIGDILE
jgi:methionyl-tRNA formyltransferase